MSDVTPNSLEPIKKVDVARMSKWPLYAVLLAGLFLLGVLVYSVNFAHNQGGYKGGRKTAAHGRRAWPRPGST